MKIFNVFQFLVFIFRKYVSYLNLVENKEQENSFCKTIFLKMKLMKTIKMCLKCKLLFTITCFHDPDEKKIEVKDEKGRKEENSHNPVFLFYPNRPNPLFSI